MRLILSLLVCTLFLTACETIKGLGRDIEDAGEKIEDVVE